MRAQPTPSRALTRWTAYTPNIPGQGASCLPANACSLPMPTTAADCIAWGVANKINTVGMTPNGGCIGQNMVDYTYNTGARQGARSRAGAHACSAVPLFY